MLAFYIRRLALVLVALAIAGCASVSTGPDDAKSDDIDTAPYSALVVEAQEARAAGDYARSAALLERAQRLEPSEPVLYLELAKTYSLSGNETQAKAMAERGLLYCTRPELCARLRSYLD